MGLHVKKNVSQGGNKDSVHDEEEKGEGAGAKQGGHQGGLWDTTGAKTDHEEGEEKYEEAKGKLADRKKKAEDAEKHEQGRGEQDLLDVTCISSSQMQSVCDIQIRIGTALVSDLISGCGSSQQLPFFVLHKAAQIHRVAFGFSRSLVVRQRA